MQCPTHFLVGALIHKSLKSRLKGWLFGLVLFFLCLFSHALLDKLAGFSYHPAVPLLSDWFWLSYHFLITCLAILFLIKLWSYWTGLCLSVLPDLDWVVRYFLPGLWKGPLLHQAAFTIFGLNWLKAPNWTLIKESALVELLFIALLLFILLSKQPLRPRPEAQRHKVRLPSQ